MAKAKSVRGNVSLANGDGMTTRRLVGHNSPPTDRIRRTASASGGSNRAMRYNPGNGVARARGRDVSGQRGTPSSVESSRLQFPPD